MTILSVKQCKLKILDVNDFQFTLVCTWDFLFTPIYTKNGCKFTHFTLTNCFFQFLQLKGQKEVRTNGAIFPGEKPENDES